MSPPVYHVVLLLLCCLWSGTVGNESESSSLQQEVFDSKPTNSTCESDCCCKGAADSCSECLTICRESNCEDCNCCKSGCGFAVEFMVAAQIALGAALLLAVSALAFLIWKMCFKNSIAMVQGRNRVRAFCGLPELPRRNSASSSLNSVQNFVIQKMRDRPPRYDESLPQMPPCYDEIVPSCTAHSSSGPPVTVYSPATLPLYEQIYPGTSMGESSNASAAAVGAERSSSAATGSRHEDSGTPHSAQSNDNARRENNTILYDEACGGMDNPAFIPEIQEQHI